MVFEIKHWDGGLSDYDDKGVRGAFKRGQNLDIRRDTDSLKAGQALAEEGIIEGGSQSASRSPSASISPSPSASTSRSVSSSASASPSAESGSASKSPSRSLSPSASLSPSVSASASPSVSAALTSVFRDLVHFFVKASDGNTYGFGNAGYIYKRDPEANYSVVYKDANGAIKGAEEKPSSSGNTYLVWATDRSVKKKLIPGRSDWNDVASVTDGLTPATWHTMKQINGALMIANKSTLALFGYDDSFTTNALDLVPGNVVNTLVERNGRTILGTARLADPNKGINAAIDTEIPLAQVGDDGDIFFANMTDTVPVKRFPGGGKVNPGGVTNLIEQVNFFEWEENALSWIDKQSVGNLAVFGVFGADSGYGGLYTYGRKNKNKPFALNLEYLLDEDEIGAVTSVDGVVIASYRSGTDFGVRAVDPNAKAQGVYYGLDLKVPVKKPSDITTWSLAEMFMSPLPPGTSVEFHYKTDRTETYTQAKTAGGATSFTTTNGTNPIFRIQDTGNLFEYKIVLNPYGNMSAEVFWLHLQLS